MLLRPTRLEDAAFVLELVNTPKWLQFIGDREVRTIDDARQYIKQKIFPQLERLGFANYTMIRKEDNAKMGSCGLYDRVGLPGVDIGFALLPEFEQQGYAYEAASRILKAGLEEFGLPEVSAITAKANIRSQRLLEKLGLTFKKHIKLPNDEEELCLYQLSIA